MSKDATLLLIYLAPAIAPFILALLLSRRLDRTGMDSGLEAEMDKSRPHSGKSLDTPRRSEWPLITEFAYRRDHFRRWVLASLFATAVLFVADLYLTAIAVLLLMPLQAALVHLRCPGCDSVTTLQGVTDGRNCLSCGQRLRY